MIEIKYEMRKMNGMQCGNGVLGVWIFASCVHHCTMLFHKVKIKDFEELNNSRTESDSPHGNVKPKHTELLILIPIRWSLTTIYNSPAGNSIPMTTIFEPFSHSTWLLICELRYTHMIIERWSKNENTQDSHIIIMHVIRIIASIKML